MQHLRHFAPIMALILVAGCASAPRTPSSVNQTSPGVEAQIGGAAVGDTVSLQDGNALGQSEVVVGRIYSAASGRQCRRLLNTDGSPMPRVACKGADGVWSFARDLQSVSSIQPMPTNAIMVAEPANDSVAIGNDVPLVPSSGSVLFLNEDGTVSNAGSEVEFNSVDVADDASTFAEPIDNNVAIGDTVTRELHANETLWSFAKRTTGNALNWRVIAETNGITDTLKLAPGTTLAIPSELVGSGG